MPMPIKKATQADGVQEETPEPQTCYAFRFRAFAQTEGEDTPIPRHTAGIHVRRMNLPDKALPSRRYTGRRGAQPGVKRPTTHSAFESLYMILYLGGGHTAGCAVRAFVCLQ